MELNFVYITTKDRTEAETIGKTLVAKKLAACVNIIEGMHSIYWWEGKMEESKEVVLIAKTTHAALPSLTALVKAMHSYECPCVVAMPIQGGSAEYQEWISSNVHPALSGR